MNTGREPYSYTSVFFLLQVFTAKQCAYPRVSRPLPLLLGVLLISLLAVAAYAQPVRYEISFENAVHHEARITATFSGLGNKPLEAVMRRSSRAATPCTNLPNTCTR
jgi:hypothetical protein